MSKAPKQPVSVLVVVYTSDLQVLLLERADFPQHWQSVTGSAEPGEALATTAVRELEEETAIVAPSADALVDWRISNRFAIFEQWRSRYAAGVTHNVEHVFGLRVEDVVEVRIAAREHLGFTWLPWRDAARRCFSWSNRDAILMLPLQTPKDSR